jgi:molybdate transport system substrate-binding protein
VKLGGPLPLLCAALALSACGDDGGDETTGSPSPGAELVVFAASSLQPAFEQYAEDFTGAEIKFSFAGSDTLAAQIRQGVQPDVYAAANTALPEELFEEGLLEEPVTFATNKLVLAVPAESKVESVEEIAQPGVSVAIGEEGVPVGDYTREVLAGLPAGMGARILDNVDSEEPDVAGVVGKLTQGAVDAGFVYISDVVAAGGEVRAIELPLEVSPEVEYGIGVGAEAGDRKLAQRFIHGLFGDVGANALAANQFGPPPTEASAAGDSG